jgi:mono/diheme cytochrome c family protein
VVQPRPRCFKTGYGDGTTFLIAAAKYVGEKCGRCRKIKVAASEITFAKLASYSPTTGGKNKMNSKVIILFLVFLFLIGIAASVWAQGSAAKGKSIVESKNCAMCHNKDGMGQPLGVLAANNSDASLKEGIAHPNKKMPQYNFTDEQLQDIVAYLRSMAH